MSNIDELKEYFNDLEEVKRFKELESYILNNDKIKKAFEALKEKQKQYVNAKEFNQLNQAKIYEEEMNELKKELLDMPFVEEYLELIDIINEKFNELTDSLENKLDKIINA